MLGAHRPTWPGAFAVGARVTVPLRGRTAGEALEALAREHVNATEIHVRAPTLDDVYIQLTGSALGDAA